MDDQTEDCCPACGTKLSGENECPECGLNLVSDEYAFETSPCPACGASLRGRPQKCEHCGADFDAEGDLIIHRIDDHLQDGDQRLANCSCQNEDNKRLGELVITTKSLYWTETDTSFWGLYMRSGIIGLLCVGIPLAPIAVVVGPIFSPFILSWVRGNFARKFARLVEGLSLSTPTVKIPKERLIKAELDKGKKFRIYQQAGSNPPYFQFRIVTMFGDDRPQIVEGINEWLSFTGEGDES